MPDIEIKRGYEVLPDNNVRFGIRVINNSDFAVYDVEVILDYSESLFELEGNKVQRLGNIPPTVPRTAKFILKPLGCIHKEEIGATVLYKDHQWKKHTEEMRPKEVHCVCPFLKEKSITRAEFLRLSNSGYLEERGVNFEGITVDKMMDFLSHTCKNRLYKVDEFSIENGRILYLAGDALGEKAYFLLTAVVKEYEGLVQVLLCAGSDKSYGLNGFLNEILDNLRHLVISTSAREIGIIKKEQVINIIDSYVNRTTFSGGEGVASVDVKDSFVNRVEIKGDEKRKRREVERQRREKEEQERLRRGEEEQRREKKEKYEAFLLKQKREEKEREAREERERKEREEEARREKKKKVREEEEGLRRQQEEQGRIAREKEEPTRKEPEGTSWKGFFAVALVLGILLLGYLALAPGTTEAPGTTKFAPTPKATTSVTPIPIFTQTVSPISTPKVTMLTSTIKDNFETGNLNSWAQETLVTWATDSFDHGIVDDGSKVAFMKGGIDNGCGGNQVLVRNDLNGNDASIQSRIKLVKEPIQHYFQVGYLSGGITGRYQSIGKGYGAFVGYDIVNNKVTLNLIRMDGTQPGPNYAYNTKYVYLKDPVILSNFDPLQWHTLQMDLKGSSITVKLDSEVKIQAADVTYTQGSLGLLYWGSCGDGPTYYDDFTVIDQSTKSYVDTTLVPAQKIFTNSIGMEFVLIPAGEFDMGSPYNEAGRFENEGPVHHVKISNAFYMGKYVVTQKQWQDIMGTSPSYFKGDNLPVEMVSWNDAQIFIIKLNKKEGTDKYRLPSEAEWEYAARAGTTTRYSFGDNESELVDYAWYNANSGNQTHEVGQKKPNPWGLYDMHGNVLEWVQDDYHDSYNNGAPTDGSAWEGDGSYIVFRGGSWKNLAKTCRSASRSIHRASVRNSDIGFRLVKDL